MPGRVRVCFITTRTLQARPLITLLQLTVMLPRTSCPDRLLAAGNVKKVRAFDLMIFKVCGFLLVLVKDWILGVFGFVSLCWNLYWVSWLIKITVLGLVGIIVVGFTVLLGS